MVPWRSSTPLLHDAPSEGASMSRKVARLFVVFTGLLALCSVAGAGLLGLRLRDDERALAELRKAPACTPTTRSPRIPQGKRFLVQTPLPVRLESIWKQTGLGLDLPQRASPRMSKEQWPISLEWNMTVGFLVSLAKRRGDSRYLAPRDIALVIPQF